MTKTNTKLTSNFQCFLFSRLSWKTCTFAVSAMDFQAAAKWRPAGGRSLTSGCWGTTWKTSTTAPPRWWWRNTGSPEAGWKHYAPNMPSSNIPPSETWCTTRDLPTSASQTQRRVRLVPVTASATCRRTALRAATCCAAAVAITHGQKSGRRNATASSTGAATSAARSVWGSTTCTRVNKCSRWRKKGTSGH